jgi:hypothetical protein
MGVGVAAFAAVSILVFVTACSSGDSPAPAVVNRAPAVSAGADQDVNEGAAAQLTGAVTDPDNSPSIAWSQTAGPAVALSSAASLSPTFTAPQVSADVVLTFVLTANDAVNSPVSDSVSVMVRDLGSRAFSVNGEDTDPAIAPRAPHLVAPPNGTGPGDGNLHVFFPGTGGAPANNSLYVEYAATLGYRSIGLSYVNDISVISVCTGTGPGAGDPDCQRDMRMENFTGADASPYIDIGPSDSIEHRLQALIAYLIATDPAGGWDPFIAGGAINWSRIAVSGHSQGGGHAGFISQQALVDRAILFSSTEPANWTREPGLTPGARRFGFANENEDNAASIMLSWSNLLLPGPLINVDAGPPGPGGSHQLTTARTECNGESTLPALHGCVVTNQHTPRNPDGSPLFGPQWAYMLGL